MSNASGSQRRSQRSSTEIRSRLQESARRLFAERGYSKTSTRLIASEADVAETLLFRHFGTKAELFDEVVLNPTRKEFASLLERWTTYGENLGNDPKRSVELYVDSIYSVFQQHRQLFMALVVAHEYQDPEWAVQSPGNDSLLTSLLNELERTAETVIQMRGWQSPDLTVAIRATFGMVVSTVLFSAWLFPQGANHPGDERIKQELVQLIYHGFAHLDTIRERQKLEAGTP